MNNTEKIIAKIQNGLKTCSEQHLIPAKDIKLLINSDGKVNLLNGDHVVVNGIDVKKVFNITAMENILVPIVPYLQKTINKLAIKKNIPAQSVIARIFTKQSDFYPCVYLHDGAKVVCELTINDFLN